MEKEEQGFEETAIVLKKEAETSPRVQALVKTVDPRDTRSIVGFGSEAANELSKTADTVLENSEMGKIDEASAMIKALTDIMDEFNIDEIMKEEPKGFLKKLFYDAKKHLDAIISKYDTMGNKIDIIHQELKKFENDIYSSNSDLDRMLETNKNYFQELAEYIVAGDAAVEHLTQEKEVLEREYEETQDNEIQFEISKYNQGIEMLSQRVHDLRIAENVAIQSIPMLESIKYSNGNLLRKIDSAFIVTLPIFKQNLATAIQLKRQKIQSDAMSELDARTNEMLLQNAHNTAEQSKTIARQSTGSSISVDTLEESYKTIMDGIAETKQIQEEAQEKRKEEKQRLEEIKKSAEREMLSGK